MADTTVKFTRSHRAEITIPTEIAFSPDFSYTDELTDFRKAAWQEWKTLPFPNEKEDAWRRTSLRSLNLDTYQGASTSGLKLSDLPEHLDQSLAEQNQGGRVFISGNWVEESLDATLQEQGVVFGTFRNVMKVHPGLLAKLLKKTAGMVHGKFAALASALSANGILLYVPRNVKVENPLQSITWVDGGGVVQPSRVLVVLDEGAEATFVHEVSSHEGVAQQSFHIGLFEILVGPAARLNFVELQSLGSNVWNITNETVTLEKDSTLDWIFGSLGSKMTKSFSRLNLAGQGATGKMSGFFFANGSQHLDHDTRQNHMAPNTTSDLLFKGALLGESRSVWQGMIYVDPTASKTDGYQANRNLVLSEKARADSIPGLEILTDDVRCTHGATVGKIDQDLVFYLQSRGLPRKEAEKLIVEGFFDPIMQRIPFENVKKRFQKAIDEKMNSY
jgi:Fe-S cluster assembly protein SufD